MSFHPACVPILLYLVIEMSPRPAFSGLVGFNGGHKLFFGPLAMVAFF